MKVKNTGLKYISIVVDTNRYEFAPNQEILFPDKQQPYVDQSILQYDDLVVISDNKTEGDKLVALIDQVNALPVSNSGVNTDLSNLSATTAVNSDLSPNALNSINLGTPSLPFKDAFLKSVNLSDGNTNPTMHLGYNKLIGDVGITITTPDNMDDTPTNTINIRTGNTNGTSLSGDIVIGTGINVDHVNSHNFKSKVIVPDDTTLRVTNGVSNLDIRSTSIESIGYPLSITTSILSITNSAFNIVSNAFDFVVSTITNSVDNFHLKPIGAIAPILKLWNESNTFSIGLDAKGALSDKVYTLPVNDGAAGNTLATDGNGNMSWVTPASGGSGATQALDNLTATAINQDLKPAIDGNNDLGSAAKTWGRLYTNSIKASGDVAANTVTVAGNLRLGDSAPAPDGSNSVNTISGGGNSNIYTVTDNKTGAGTSSSILTQTGNTEDGNSGDIGFRAGVPTGTGVRGKFFVEASVIDVNNSKIINGADPVNPQDFSTKNYTDVSGLTKANTTLNNLGSTAVNTNLNADTLTTATFRDIGATVPFRFLRSVNFRNTAQIFTLTGDFTSGSNQITNVSGSLPIYQFSGYYFVNVAGVISFASITAYNSATLLTMSANATSTVTGQTFYLVSTMAIRSEDATIAGQQSGVSSVRTGNVTTGTSGFMYVQTGAATGAGGVSGQLVVASGTTTTGPSGNTIISSGNSSSGGTTGNTVLTTGTTSGTKGIIVALETLSMSSKKITDVATPVNPQDAVNKTYADSVPAWLPIQNKTSSFTPVTKGQYTLKADNRIDITLPFDAAEGFIFRVINSMKSWNTNIVSLLNSISVDIIGARIPTDTAFNSDLTLVNDIASADIEFADGKWIVTPNYFKQTKVISDNNTTAIVPAANSVWLNQGQNTGILTEGTWKLSGRVLTTTTGAANYITQLFAGFFVTNGDDTTDIPANLDSAPNLTVLTKRFPAASAYDGQLFWSDTTNTQTYKSFDVPELIVEVGNGLEQQVFLNVRPSFVDYTNSNVFVIINAVRLN